MPRLSRNFLKGLFDHARLHHGMYQMPSWVRRRIYRELLTLDQEESRAKRMLNLHVMPRLCVFDESRVAMLRPADRDELHFDTEMQAARNDRAQQLSEARRERRQRLEEQRDSKGESSPRTHRSQDQEEA